MSVARQIRVLLLIKGLGLGGAERLLERAIPYLDREQFHYQVAYLLPSKSALVPPFRHAGIEVHCLNFRGMTDAAVLFRLIALLKRERIDLIHAHLPVAGVLARLAKRPARIRAVVYTEHGVPSHYRPITRSLNTATYRFNDCVIAVSMEVAQQVRPYVRHGRPHLVTIPNAVDADLLRNMAGGHEEVCREFDLPANAYIVVTVGNLRRVKGHRYLLAAARRVIEREPRARFLVVGLGPLAASLAAEAKRLGLDGHVIFTGFRPDAIRLVGAADLFVLPSLNEGMPVSLLEAMALGRPVLATRVGGIPEVVASGETGILVEPGDVERLEYEIITLLQDQNRRDELGASAHQSIQEGFTVRQMVASIEDVYRQVAG